MANLAQIQSIAQGQFFVKDSLGNLVELKVGDTVSLNDTIVAASSNTDLSKIEILFDTNELITLSQGEQLLDTTLIASTFGNEELAFDKQEVDETLNAWNNAQDGDAADMETAAGDVTEQATNAGDERAADGGALRSKFNSRDGASTNVESDLRDTSFGGGNTEEPQEQIPTELLNPVGTTTPVPPASIPEITTPFISTVTLSSVGSGDEDGATVTYTATFTTAPKVDEIVSFKVDGVDYSITVKAGELTGTTTLNYSDIDVFVDPTTISAPTDLATTNNSNYEDLKAVNSATKYDVADSIDTTTVTLSSVGSGDEDGATVTYTATFTTAPKVDEIVSFKVDGVDY
ncbi:immunoglobulin-like domain-containing protein, partial [Aliarcobacter cryaerophilus]|uniref:immunoglobulin-like domain-containing protein n=1 Tax=Aliarcobacter cryaerophilus TaxID=28198 RepID=UPI0028CB76EE